MVDVSTYDPLKVTMLVNGRVITGYAPDSKITASRNEDRITPAVGCDGDVSYAINANRTGTITLNLASTSSSLPYLRSISELNRNIAISIADANDRDSFFLNTERGRILKMPDINRNKGIESIQVQFYVPELDPRYGV